MTEPARPSLPIVPTGADDSYWARVGGHATFDRLVRRFYEGVAVDPVLRPMYPEADLEGAIWRLTAFLEQYWGGPTTYSERRGHPRLIQRHVPFKVNPEARDHWLAHMTASVEELTADGTLSIVDREQLLDYLDRAAHALVNTFED